MLLADIAVFQVVAIVVFLLLVLICVTVVLRFGGLWFQAYMSGVPLRLLDLIGMRLRKVDVRAAVQTLIMATQGGVPLTRVEVERAYMQGVDIEKITLAMIRAKREGVDVTFQELVDADIDGRLEERLAR